MKELPKEILDIDEEILSYIRTGMEHQDSEAFNRLALRVFELQTRYIPIYRRYCEKRGVTPETISSWDQIPALPTDAFKVMELAIKCAKHGLQSAMSDAMSGFAMSRAALTAAGYNVRINVKSLGEVSSSGGRMLGELGELEKKAEKLEAEIKSVMKERGGI